MPNHTFYYLKHKFGVSIKNKVFRMWIFFLMIHDTHIKNELDEKCLCQKGIVSCDIE
jgi:hypothetical protein